MSEEDRDEETNLKKSLYIFGTDFAKIPCFRSSILNGAGTGFAGGLLYFLFTSKPSMSSHVGFGTFWVSTFVYWFHCSYKYAQNKFNINQIKGALKDHLVSEGIGENDESSKKTNIEIASV